MTPFVSPVSRILLHITALQIIGDFAICYCAVAKTSSLNSSVHRHEDCTSEIADFSFNTFAIFALLDGNRSKLSRADHIYLACARSGGGSKCRKSKSDESRPRRSVIVKIAGLKHSMKEKVAQNANFGAT